MSTITLNLNDENQIETVKAFLKALKIKFTETKEKQYNPEFVSKVLESKEQIKNGKVTRIEKDNLKDFLGL